MVIHEELRLIELLVRFENAVLDHLQRAAGAFARAEILQHKLLFAFPVVIERRVLFKGGHDGIGNQLVLEFDLACTIHESRQSFAGKTVAPIHGDQMCNRSRYALGRQLDHQLSDLRRSIDPPAHMQFIKWRDMLADAFSYSMQTNRGDMVLGAGIVAAADLDCDIAQILRHPPCRKYFRQSPRESLGGRNPQAARIGARAGDNIFDQFCSWIGQTLRGQVRIEVGNARLRHPSNNHILIDRRPDVAVGVALRQIGNVQHLLRREIAHEQFGHGCDVALLLLTHHIGAAPHLERGLNRRTVGMAVGLSRRPLRSIGGRRHDEGDRLIRIGQ